MVPLVVDVVEAFVVVEFGSVLATTTDVDSVGMGELAIDEVVAALVLTDELGPFEIEASVVLGLCVTGAPVVTGCVG